MLTQHQLWRQSNTCVRRSIAYVLVALAMLLSPCGVFAQDQERPSAAWDVTKRVVLDPTTYAPAILGYDATMRDWNSSQPFFRYGFVERNSRFTITGLPNDVAVGYEDGRHRILADAFANLQMSLVNNATDAIVERVLIQRYPEHRTLFRTLGWVEKISFASFMSYRLSADHYRQWQQNEQASRQLGIR